ncbi:hypothetical protein NP233_g10023 [Leucocoprinus birnbaumii]|uniref:EamA domain-containing protein n=1 Tax=Leucocoprinus birnbaumii TaxID=56174 RepID=A0AAD5VJ36_9AGAR|nr:hypothetical protein NP233_g10023 [Leucocoprinus birnbaumii]
MVSTLASTSTVIIQGLTGSARVQSGDDPLAHDDLFGKSLGARSRKREKLQAVFEAAKSIYHRNIGLLLVIGSQLFLSLMNVAVKKLNAIEPPVTALQLIVVRMSITWICSVIYMFSTGVPDPFRGPESVRLLLVLRGVSGFFGLFGLYFSLQYLSLSDATVLTFLAPLCTATSGALFLGEKFARREAAAGLISLLGVVLIARPPFLFSSHNEESSKFLSPGTTAQQRLIAVGVALIGVLGATGAYTTLRAIGKRAHPLHSLVIFSFYSIVVASVGMIVTDTPFILPTRLDWLFMLFLVGIFGLTTQILLTMGLARETAGRGTSGIYSQIIFATVLERIFFDYDPSILSIVGTVIILLCALYVAFTKKSSPGSTEENKEITLRDTELESLERGLLDGDDEESNSEKSPTDGNTRPRIELESPRSPGGNGEN